MMGKVLRSAFVFAAMILCAIAMSARADESEARKVSATMAATAPGKVWRVEVLPAPAWSSKTQIELAGDGRHVVWAERDDKRRRDPNAPAKPQVIHVWDLEAGKEVHQFEVPVIDEFRLMEAGTIVVWPAAPRGLNAWEIVSGKAIKVPEREIPLRDLPKWAAEIPGRTFFINKVSHSTDGRWVLAMESPMLELRDAKTGAVAGRVARGLLTDRVSWLADGSGFNCLWNSEVKKVIRLRMPAAMEGREIAISPVKEIELSKAPAVRSLWISADGKFAQAGAMRIDLAKGRGEELKLPAGGKFLVSGDGKRVMEVQRNGIEMFRAADGDKSENTLNEKVNLNGTVNTGWKEELMAAFWNGNEARAITIGRASVGSKSRYAAWDVVTGKELWNLEQTWHSPVVSADGKRVIASPYNGKNPYILIDAETGDTIRTGEWPAGVGRAEDWGERVFSGDGRVMAIEFKNKTWFFVDLDAEKVIGQTQRGEDSIMALSSDGKLAITTGVDAAIEVVETRGGKRLGRIEATQACGAFTPDGRIITLSGKRVCDWGKLTPEQLAGTLLPTVIEVGE